MDLYLSVLLTSVIALFVLYKRKLTLPALILAWISGVAVGFYGGYLPFTALILTFVLTLVLDKLKKTKRDETRNIFQMIGRLLIPVTSMMLYYFLEIEAFYIAYYAVLATSLGDTFAGSLGPFSKKKPVNIFTFEKVEKGDSGGITIFGSVVSALGGIVIGGIYFIQSQNIIAFIVIIILSLIGSLVDSILGIAFQAQYRCIACKQVVEENKHCRKKAKLIRGYPFMSNSLVNLLSNLLILIVCYFIFI